MRFPAVILFVAGVAFAQQPTPFSVIEVSRQVDATGKVTAESRFLFATNHDGSIALVDLDPAAGGVRQIIDVVKHRTILVNPQSRNATISPNGVAPLEPRDACEQRFRKILHAVVSVDRSAGVVQGVALHRISVTLPQGTTMDILVAPSLGCHMLQVQNRRNGVVSETRAYENLQINDPAPSFFEVPTDYQVTEVAYAR